MDDRQTCACRRDSRPAWMGCNSADVQVLAMAYVPKQLWGAVYDAEKGLCRGTIFPDLDKPLEVIR